MLLQYLPLHLYLAFCRKRNLLLLALLGPNVLQGRLVTNCVLLIPIKASQKISLCQRLLHKCK